MDKTLTDTQRSILFQADINQTAPGRLLIRADTPELLSLELWGYIERLPYYPPVETQRLLKDALAGVSDAHSLLGASGWWLTDKGRVQARRKRFS